MVECNAENGIQSSYTSFPNLSTTSHLKSYVSHNLLFHNYRKLDIISFHLVEHEMITLTFPKLPSIRSSQNCTKCVVLLKRLTTDIHNNIDLISQGIIKGDWFGLANFENKNKNCLLSYS